MTVVNAELAGKGSRARARASTVDPKIGPELVARAMEALCDELNRAYPELSFTPSKPGTEPPPGARRIPGAVPSDRNGGRSADD
jgi:hypothetical protein